ncbi:META domain-containing protein [Benzoatithermus flavus]|jgi:heat shock protein HslJ|uniref:META domain-containing protein n=1 Tax=Benzoatithermus flavus TaxID=3108223 RepID=A0ABU8XNZ2_9PROT
MRKAALLSTLTVLLFAGAAGAKAQQEPSAPYRIGDKLAGTRWQAQSLRGGAVTDPASATIDFLPDDQVRGQAGCKRFVGPYATRDDKITIGPIRMSLGDCRGSEAALEERMIEALEKAERVELGGDRLILHDRQGEPSRFAPRRP